MLLPQASVAVQSAPDDLGAAATVADAVAVGDGDRAAGIRGVATPFLLVLMSAGHSSTTLAGQVNAGRGGVAHGEGLHGVGAVAAGVGGRPGAPDDLGAAATVADAVAVGDGDRAAGIRSGGIPFLLVLMSAGHSSTTLAGQIIAGGVVSRTVRVCTALVLLPQASVAVQRREMILVPPQLLLTLSL